MRNVPASVQSRLRRYSHEHHLDNNLVLRRYAVERLFHRLDALSYGGNFVLKGGMMFYLWGYQARTTRDLDLLSRELVGDGDLIGIYRAVCDVQVEPEDGLTFLPDSVTVEDILREQDLGGKRVRLEARLATATIRLQIDICFGQVVTPPADWQEFPPLLDLPGTRIQVYPRETVVAEKWEALVARGAVTQRFKDVWDLWYIAHEFEFGGQLLAEAIGATFRHRHTSFPEGVPTPLTEAFATGGEAQREWRAFFMQHGMKPEDWPPFVEVVQALQHFLLPPTKAAASDQPFTAHWLPAGPWEAEAASL